MEENENIQEKETGNQDTIDETTGETIGRSRNQPYWGDQASEKKNANGCSD